jgi:hypothetical protein
LPFEEEVGSSSPGRPFEEKAMPDINLSFKHGRTQEDARARLAEAVASAQQQFGSMVNRVEWSNDGNSVHLSGNGFQVDVWVDAVEVHLIGDIPLLGRLLGGPLLSGLKQILGRSFQKQLT